METNKCVAHRFLTDNSKDGFVSCGFITHPNKKFAILPHSQEYYICSILLSGEGTLVDENDCTYPLQPSTLFQKPPHVSVEVKPDLGKNWQEFFIIVGEPAYNFLVSLNVLHLSERVFRIHVRPYLIRWFNEIVKQLETTTFAELPEVLFILQKLLINLHREDIRSYESDTAAIIAGAKQLLAYNYSQPVSLKGIAASFNISYEKFRKVFKQEVGMSPLQYRQEAKFHLAQRLLFEGIPVKVVATEVGYSDPFIFSRQFKKYIGEPPSALKNRKAAD